MAVKKRKKREFRALVKRQMAELLEAVKLGAEVQRDRKRTLRLVARDGEILEGKD